MTLPGAAPRTPPPLTDEEVQKFCDFFYRRTGILFTPAKRYFIEKRIVKRMALTGATCFRQYFSGLRFSASQQELQMLINDMTINETYFLREEHQFEALAGPILSEILGSRGRAGQITIWSVPCSTGEEPYSIAMKLLEDWPPIDEVEVRILASDIDTAALAAAEAGIYSERSVARVPPAWLRRYFTRLPGNRHAISREIVDAVDRAVVNISDPAFLRAMPPVDVIFCRNLLIYFDEESRRRAIDRFHELLTPGGFLLLGHSESISRSSALFRIRKFRDCLAYQKDGHTGGSA